MAIAHYIPVHYLLAENKWGLWETEGIFLKVLAMGEDTERGAGSGKGEKGKVRSSDFAEQVRCRHVPVSRQAGSATEGQGTWVRSEEWSGGSDPAIRMQKNPQNCMVCYSGVLFWVSIRKQPRERAA